MKYQSSNRVLMIRPASFGYNPETAASNVFQQNLGAEYSTQALEEFDAMVDLLRSEGIAIWLEADQPIPAKPDAIFPNNWLGIHPGKRVVFYPMEAENRRLERDPILIERLKQDLSGYSYTDWSSHELAHEFLEGTGSVVLDHIDACIYACRSSRTNARLVEELGQLLNYRTHIFDSLDEQGKPYYHTNVMLSIGTQFAVICAESIPEVERAEVLDSLRKSGRQLLLISRKQVAAFAGNMLEVRNSSEEKMIILSSTALDALEASEIAFLQQFALLLPVDIPTIERIGGGSVRCMLAEVF
ncbi:MAG TPA: arginine deiminase-related protein [Flavobacteriales bacterium]|nr:arginine deiminase-related protein [Flavobacteriales bacterium]